MVLKTAIAWVDLTLKVRSSLCRTDQIILNKLNGSADFGEVTAVLGPSGAGLTSLLMCLNGMNNDRLSAGTKIRINSNQKIRSTFIGDNEKEFLSMGLTAKQNLIYASKLKNSSAKEHIDHELNVMTIMSELLISDIMDTKVKNCSGGELKRLAIALELTALNKPNLISFDEPITNLDSNVAEVVMSCLKGLAVKHRIALVVTVHQPNSDIVQMLDKMYVLAKGGVCVYSGPPQEIRHHLLSCNITCNANQLPIETLVTIAAKGSDDQKVIHMKSKTNLSIESRITGTEEKLILRKNKRFHIKDIYLLLSRTIVEFYCYKWPQTLLSILLVTAVVLIFSFSFNRNIGEFNDCFNLMTFMTKNVSCLQYLDSDRMSQQNTFYLLLVLFSVTTIQCIAIINEKINKLKIFAIEHQNNWYSSGVYYVKELVVDLIPTTITATLVAVLTFFITNQLNESKRFWTYFYVIQLVMHSMDAFGQLVSIMFFRNKMICFAIGFVYGLMGLMLNEVSMQSKDMTDVIKILRNIFVENFMYKSVFISIYGFDRCPKTETSSIMYFLQLKDGNKEFFENTSYILALIVCFRALAFVVLLATKNQRFYKILINHLKNKLRKEEIEIQIELQKVSRILTEYNDNHLDIDLSDGSTASADSSFEYQSEVDKQNQINTNGETDTKRTLCMAWIDLTLKVNKTFFTNEKIILRGIKGFVEFGTLSALIGPSGAGKTSLLKCLNGMNSKLMTKDSKILLSGLRRIKTCFISEHQRERLLCGLTVEQSLIYSSKLKNIGKTVDHSVIVQQLMEEMILNDVKSVPIEKCSYGQQKRIVLAMELTPEFKPNLILMDEPTSGVDSYSSLLMIKCFKRVAQKHSLSIIASIHQPNIELLMTFDVLYCLSKGGLSVYSGRPQDLKRHLKECHIVCHKNQVPIEVLMKISTNGCFDDMVIELSDKTCEELRRYDNRVSTELKLNSNEIPVKTKNFSFLELWYLFVRVLTYTVQFRWKYIILQSAVCLACGWLLRNAYHVYDLEGPDGCLPVMLKRCPLTPESLKMIYIIKYHVLYIYLSSLAIIPLIMILSSLTFSSDIKIFGEKHRNYWHSIESYFLVKTVLDLIPWLITIVLFVLIIDIYEMDDTFKRYLLVLGLFALSAQSIGHIMGILFEGKAVSVTICLIPVFMLYNGMIFTDKDMSDIASKLTDLNPFKHFFAYMIVHFYGFNRCREGMVSAVLYKLQLNDDSFERSWILLIALALFYRFLSYLCLNFKVNWHSIEFRINKFMNFVTIWKK